jgi:hypothetical protein
MEGKGDWMKEEKKEDGHTWSRRRSMEHQLFGFCA